LIVRSTRSLAVVGHVFRLLDPLDRRAGELDRAARGDSSQADYFFQASRDLFITVRANGSWPIAQIGTSMGIFGSSPH
jgi:hypothetical protein